MRKHELRRQYKFRVQVVRLYRHLRTQVAVQRTSELTLATTSPRRPATFRYAPVASGNGIAWPSRRALAHCAPNRRGRTPSTTRCRRW